MSVTFGLAYEHYTHFTSPIRRYPDLLVHRAIKAVLAGEKYHPEGQWDDIGLQCSATERRADEATRDVENWLKCFFMKERVGEEFEGSISAVTSFGIFVALDAVYIEGLVHVSELGADYFQFDNVKHQMLGERTGQRFRLGDRVKVRLVRVDLEKNKIDFVLAASTDKEGRSARPAAGNAASAKRPLRSGGGAGRVNAAAAARVVPTAAESKPATSKAKPKPGKATKAKPKTGKPKAAGSKKSKTGKVIRKK